MLLTVHIGLAINRFKDFSYLFLLFGRRFWNPCAVQLFAVDFWYSRSDLMRDGLCSEDVRKQVGEQEVAIEFRVGCEWIHIGAADADEIY